MGHFKDIRPKTDTETLEFTFRHYSGPQSAAAPGSFTHYLLTFLTTDAPPSPRRVQKDFCC